MTEPEHDRSTVMAELRAMDEAVAAGAVTTADPVERELQELALALDAEAQEPSEEFAAELRTRVQEGFARDSRLPRLHLPDWPQLRRPPLQVMGGVASIVVALAVAVALFGQEGRERTDGGDSAVQPLLPDAGTPGAGKGRPAPEAARDSGGGSLSMSPPQPPPGAGGFAPGQRKRRIERSASLTLAAPADRLDRVADGIVRLIERQDGFVLRSSLSTGDEGTTGGEFELRVPAERLASALTGLSKLADVRAQPQDGQDVTPEFASAEERLQAARAERRSLLRRLERAPSDSAAESIRRRLDLNAGEIRGLRGQVRELRTRTNYARVAVTLQAAKGDGEESSPGGSDGVGGALDDAVDSLSGSLEIAIRALGVLLPLALVGGAAAFGARTVRRRRREAVLG